MLLEKGSASGLVTSLWALDLDLPSVSGQQKACAGWLGKNVESQSALKGRNRFTQNSVQFKAFYPGVTDEPQSFQKLAGKLNNF